MKFLVFVAIFALAYSKDWVSYSQKDPKWGNILNPDGSGTKLRDTGSFVTCMAMAFTTWNKKCKDKTPDPGVLANYLKETNSYYGTQFRFGYLQSIGVYWLGCSNEQSVNDFMIRTGAAVLLKNSKGEWVIAISEFEDKMLVIDPKTGEEKEYLKSQYPSACYLQQ